MTRYRDKQDIQKSQRLKEYRLHRLPSAITGHAFMALHQYPLPIGSFTDSHLNAPVLKKTNFIIVETLAVSMFTLVKTTNTISS
jgi:hypothetical protein